MTMIFTELSEKLAQLDEITLLELLNVTSQDLVDRFQDVIEDRFTYLSENVE